MAPSLCTVLHHQVSIWLYLFSLLHNRGAASVSAGYPALLVLAGSLPCLELLLEKGASVNASSRMGTPLLWAMGSGDEACAAFLLDHGADPNATDESHITPVLLAAATGCHGPPVI